MNPRQAAFAAEYIANGGNATQAARDAGYSGSDPTLAQTGHDLLRHREVRGVLAAAGALAVQRVTASTELAAGSAAWIVARAVALADGALQDRDKIAALALLARRLAEWRDGPAVVQQIVALPHGTTLDDIRALVAATRQRLDAPRDVDDLT